DRVRHGEWNALLIQRFLIDTPNFRIFVRVTDQGFHRVLCAPRGKLLETAAAVEGQMAGWYFAGIEVGVVPVCRWAVDPTCLERFDDHLVAIAGLKRACTELVGPGHHEALRLEGMDQA